MADSFVAEIRIFPFNFAPLGWALCQGQILQISQNTAVFSLLGTNYGGDGRSNFALPNLQDRVPIDQGSGPGLTPRNVGETGGESTVALVTANLPAHTHTVKCDVTGGNDYGPAGDYPAPDAGGDTEYSASHDGQLSSSSVVASGGNTAHNNLQPYLALNYCIALQGIFPARS